MAEADGAILSQVARLDQLPEDNRLIPEQVVGDIQARGKPAYYEKGVPEIIERLRQLARSGDVVAVFSNGGFDNIPPRATEKLTPLSMDLSLNCLCRLLTLRISPEAGGGAACEAGGMGWGGFRSSMP